MTKTWQVLKAEIKYNNLVFLYIFICSVLGFFVLHYWTRIFKEVPPNNNIGYLSLAYMFSYFVMAFLGTPWSKEKRPRQLVSLPISIRQIGAAHLIIFIIYWMAIVMLFFVYSVVSRYFYLDSMTIISLGSMTGLVLIVYTLLAFLAGFPESVGRKILEISTILIFIFISVAGIVHIFQEKGDHHVIDRILSWIFKSEVSAIILVCCGLGFPVLRLILSRQRSSYVE
ncbi:MAG: hypothetical protein JSV96_12020 [Candidatus Aminicenantes bacterium]|nr:MAG: hypothetical protein JSV96_12020 [Candidatus Aminicenantes bacterium]